MTLTPAYLIGFLETGWKIKRSSMRSSWTRAKAGPHGGWSLVDHATVHDMLRDGLLEYTGPGQLEVRPTDKGRALRGVLTNPTNP